MIESRENPRIRCNCKTYKSQNFCDHVADFLKQMADAPLPHEFFVPMFRAVKTPFSSSPVFWEILCVTNEPDENGFRELRTRASAFEAIGVVGPRDGRNAVRIVLLEWLKNELAKGMLSCRWELHDAKNDHLLYGRTLNSGPPEWAQARLLDTWYRLTSNRCYACVLTQEAVKEASLGEGRPARRSPTAATGARTRTTTARRSGVPSGGGGSSRSAGSGGGGGSGSARSAVTWTDRNGVIWWERHA